MSPASDPQRPEPKRPIRDTRRAFRELQEQTAQLERHRERLIHRLLAEQRERGLRVFHRPAR